MSSDESIYYLTASEAIRLFKAKTLSPVELMRAVIARAEDVNPKLNAFTATFYDRALEQARKAEIAYARDEGSVRPLEGIPIVIKDLHPVAGEITTFGSKVFEKHRSIATAPTVQRLFNAGTIMHGRTTTPEFAIGIITHSRHWGVTRNPWNLDYSPCGSSGGAGAALASGMTVLADGTDSGGSIRAPASACGIVGYLPPYGRNPASRDYIYESLLRYGPLTRSVADAALMQNVMSGVHLEDPATLREVVKVPKSHAPIKGLKIGLSIDLGFYEIDPEVESAVRGAAKLFSDLGCVVEEVRLPWTRAIADAMNRYIEFLVHGAYSGLLPEQEANLSKHIKYLIGKGENLKGAYVAFFFATRAAMWDGIRTVLDKYDILLCPTLSVPGVLAEHDSMDQNFTVNGKPHGAYLEWGLTYPFNMLSYLPVMSIPCGSARNNLPIGMQIVGRTYDDLTVFRAAAAFEAAQPWRTRHPEI
jgi:Asp-tRNA(Asn)/Glu-tRNA(Gln) amidotransferase A subunit family amidase